MSRHTALPAPEAVRPRRPYDGEAALHGHFGQGCVHTRIPFDLVTADGVTAFLTFLDRASDLVLAYGGSLSGEHGDGRSRGRLLPKMFGPAVMEAFEQVKAVFDPDDMMNPGKVVAPYGIAENLRLGTSWTPADPPVRFGYPDDEGSFQRAVMRCVGVGRCRAHSGGVMCPSYRATGEEEHSTRGRARLLFETLGGHADSAVGDGWRSAAVADALDLCLACKGCKSDCPMSVDMATYKAEFLSHHYAGRLRPAAHYALGWLPLWARLASLAPGPSTRSPTPPGWKGSSNAWAASNRPGRCPSSPARASPTGTASAGHAVTAGAGRCSCGPTPSPTTSPRGSAGPRSRCWRRPDFASSSRPAPCAAA